MAFLLGVASIMVLVLYVHHIGTSLRVSSLIELVGSDTRKLVDAMYPSRQDEPRGQDVAEDIIPAPRSGVVFKVDVDGLVETARDGGLHDRDGHGDRRLHAGWRRAQEGPGRAARGVGRARGRAGRAGARAHAEPGRRVRHAACSWTSPSASSPTFTDPTAAVQAIDRLHDCLRQLARREFPSGRHEDPDGTLRFVIPTLDWEGYLRLGFDEIRIAGAARRRSRGACGRRWRICAAWRLPSCGRRSTASSRCSRGRPGVRGPGRSGRGRRGGRRPGHRPGR